MILCNAGTSPHRHPRYAWYICIDRAVTSMNATVILVVVLEIRFGVAYHDVFHGQFHSTGGTGNGKRCLWM